MRVGFAICDPGVSFGAIVGSGARERAAELGVDLSIVSVFTAEQHVAAVQKFLAARVDVLIVEAIDSEVIAPVLQEAVAAGIPVVVADMRIHGVAASCSVLSANVIGGEIAAAFLVDQLHGRGTIAHLHGLPTADNAIDRSRGFHNVVDGCAEIGVVEASSEWTREVGAATMRELLAAHPSVEGVLANSDSLALGAMDAIEEAGLTGRVVVVGFDAMPEALVAVARGTMAATVRQMPQAIGRTALELAVRIHAGEEVPNLVEIDVGLVTSANVVEASLEALPLFSRILPDLGETTAALTASEARAHALAGEQAALRRVATRVAEGASPDELFFAVAHEVAGIVDLPVVAVNRYEPDGTFTIVGIAGETHLTVGSRFRAEESGIGGMILATGQSSRWDNQSTMPGRIGDAVRKDRLGSTVGVPISVEGRLWGFMVAAAKAGRPIPADTEVRLARFTELVATAVSNASTRAELLSSRARLVSTADETRRRLERDLHDGIQQWLVALALRARKAARVSGSEHSVEDELSRLADDLVAVTDELREISRGIHPAILSDSGLDDALAALARRSAIPVELDVSFPRRVDPTVEATVYYLVAESITNAVKHAQASSVAVRGGLHGEGIELEIRDDGVGGAEPGRGTGLLGLKDRIDTLGGTISLVSPMGGGTTIEVKLPATLGGREPPSFSKSKEGVSAPTSG